MKKNYEWVLFDADETLFRFDAFQGLQIMFSKWGVAFSEQDFQAYQIVNVALWSEYQKGTISAQHLQQQRFDTWAKTLQIPHQTLHLAFIDAMTDICAPLEGATSLLNTLKGKSKLGIITNGFTQLQQTRLQRTGLDNHFDLLVISEQVGVAKPHRDIFEHAFNIMGKPSRENVLMVGDNPIADVQGGLGAGFDTCWFNPNKTVAPAGVKPHFEVASLSELELLLV